MSVKRKPLSSSLTLHEWKALTVGYKVPCVMDSRRYSFDVHNFYPLSSTAVKRFLKKYGYGARVPTSVPHLCVRAKACIRRVVRFGENVTMDVEVCDEWLVCLGQRISPALSVPGLANVWSFSIPRRMCRHGPALHVENLPHAPTHPEVFVCGVLGIQTLPATDDVNWLYCHVSYISKRQS